MSAITLDDLRQLTDLSLQLSNIRLCGDEEDAEADEDSLIRVMRRCLQRDDDVADDVLDRHIDRVLRAAGSALRHYTMQKSLDDMRAAMRAAMLPLPLFDSQCRELCAALSWQGGTYHLVLAEVKRLKAADPAPHVGIIRELLNIAGLAWRALDDSEEVETPDGRGHVISDIDFDALTQALDELDELPDNQPGVTMSPAMKAAWALRSMLAESQPQGDSE